MSKRIYIVHKWEGLPSSDWYPWLKQKLEALGFDVIVPAMPNTDEPEIDAWVGHLTGEIRDPDENVYLIGHSMGCQTIMRYLENVPKPIKIGGVLFVAGFFDLKRDKIAEEGDEVATIAKPWLETPIDTEKVKHCATHFRALFSDDDPWVPVEQADVMKERLNASTRVLTGRDHITQTEVPEILEEFNQLLNDQK